MNSTHSTLESPTRPADVDLRLPAENAFVSILRTTAAGLAARLDFTIDDIEDLRMAISEACSMLLPEADEGSDLSTEFFLSSRQLTARVSVAAKTPGAPDLDSWAWQVLSALTTTSDLAAEDGRLTVIMTVSSSTEL